MTITCETPIDLDINLARSWLTVMLMQIQLLTILGPSVMDWPEGVFQAPLSDIAAKKFSGSMLRTYCQTCHQKFATSPLIDC
jgi:hypothetical protein